MGRYGARIYTGTKCEESGCKSWATQTFYTMWLCDAHADARSLPVSTVDGGASFRSRPSPSTVRTDKERS